MVSLTPVYLQSATLNAEWYVLKSNVFSGQKAGIETRDVLQRERHR